MQRRNLTTLATLAIAVALPTMAKAGQATTTRIETRPFYGATVTLEAGVRVFRPLPPHSNVIINPGGRTPVYLGLEQRHGGTGHGTGHGATPAAGDGPADVHGSSGYGGGVLSGSTSGHGARSHRAISHGVGVPNYRRSNGPAIHPGPIRHVAPQPSHGGGGKH